MSDEDIGHEKRHTYSSQSTATMRVTSLAGRPTAVSTITMVTSPAFGTPAAPMLATVDMMLRTGHRIIIWVSIPFTKQLNKKTQIPLTL